MTITVERLLSGHVLAFSAPEQGWLKGRCTCGGWSLATMRTEPATRMGQDFGDHIRSLIEGHLLTVQSGDAS